MDELNGIGLTDREKDIIIVRTQLDLTVEETMKKLNVTVDEVHKVEDKVRDYFRNTHTNMSKMQRDFYKDLEFRMLVNKALEEADVRDMDDKEDCIKWMIGEDYGTLEYQFWPYRITENTKIVGIDAGTPVKALIRAAASLWKEKRILIGAKR